MRSLTLTLAVVASTTLGIARPCDGAPIRIAFEAIDRADAVAGEDLWEYRYFVDDFTFDVDQGFSVEFDAALYTLIDPFPPVANAGWDILVLQPDPALASPGLYDALAFVPGASLANPFTVSFVWLGSPDTPGSQPFTVNEFDAAGNLLVIERGRTVPLQTVPEPAVLVLVGAGALTLSRRARSRKRSR